MCLPTASLPEDVSDPCQVNWWLPAGCGWEVKALTQTSVGKTQVLDWFPVLEHLGISPHVTVSDSLLGLWNILAGCQLLGLILVQRQAAQAASAAGGVRADEGHESQLPRDKGFRREWRHVGRALGTQRRQGHLAPDRAEHGSTAVHCTELLHSELWAPRPLCGAPPGRTRPAKGFGRLQKTKSQLKVT